MSMTRPLDINSGDTVLGSYDLTMPTAQPATTVSLAGGNVQTDVSCPDGSSYTLGVPVPDQSYAISANDKLLVAITDPEEWFGNELLDSRLRWGYRDERLLQRQGRQ